MSAVARLQLVGMPVFASQGCDRTVPIEHAELRAVENWFRARGRRIVDVPHDGDCTLYCVSPAFAAKLRRPVTTDEVRELIVTSLRISPAYGAVLRQELANEQNAAGPSGATASVASLLDHWSHQSVYLPPVVVARVTENFTGVPVMVWAAGTTTDGTNPPFVLHTPDVLDVAGRPQPSHLQVLYVDRLSHMCRVIVHDTGSLEPAR